MPEFSLGLALQDFVPVVVSAVGWWFVVRVVARKDPAAGPWAALGAILVVAGGLSRAVWKLIVATDGPDVGALHAALYPFLVAGFLWLAVALVSVHRRRMGRLVRWFPLATVILLGIASLLIGSGSGRVLPVLWLAVATAGSVTVGILLAIQAWSLGHNLVAALFLIGIAATFVLNGLARLPDQSESMQWIAQSANTLNQLVFTLAAWRLWVAETGRNDHESGVADGTKP